MILLIMAAGSGSRYGKLKQFDQIGPKGQFLMEYGIFDAIKNDFNHIVVITKEENQIQTVKVRNKQLKVKHKRNLNKRQKRGCNCVVFAFLL